MKILDDIEGFVGFIIVVFIILIIGAGVTGWIKNIVKLTRCDFEAPYKAEIIRVVGIVPPVGAVVGWLNIDDCVKGR